MLGDGNYGRRNLHCSTVAYLHRRDFRSGGMIKPRASKVREINPLRHKELGLMHISTVIPHELIVAVGHKMAARRGVSK